MNKNKQNTKIQNLRIKTNESLLSFSLLIILRQQNNINWTYHYFVVYFDSQTAYGSTL